MKFGAQRLIFGIAAEGLSDAKKKRTRGGSGGARPNDAQGLKWLIEDIEGSSGRVLTTRLNFRLDL